MQNLKKPDNDANFSLEKFGYMACQVSLISLAVSFFTQPFQALLNSKQQQGFIPQANVFHWAYRGFLSYMITGQKRGAIAITAKQTNQKQEQDSKLWFTLAFSQADILFSNGLKTKSKLENAKILDASNFRWSAQNFYKLTFNNWGSRSLSGLINYSALGFFGDYCASSFSFESQLLNQILGGLSAGIFASLFSTFPDIYSDQKTLASKMNAFKLETISSHSMFKNLIHECKQQPMKLSIQSLLKQYFSEISVRIPINAVTFAIIFGAHYYLNQEPNTPSSFRGKGGLDIGSSSE